MTNFEIQFGVFFKSLSSTGIRRMSLSFSFSLTVAVNYEETKGVFLKLDIQSERVQVAVCCHERSEAKVLEEIHVHLQTPFGKLVGCR